MKVLSYGIIRKSVWFVGGIFLGILSGKMIYVIIEYSKGG